MGSFVDGDDADAGNPVRSHVCGVKRQHNVIRSSKSAMTIVLKTDSRMQPMGFTGFNVRCHAIKWGAWFGAVKRAWAGSKMSTTITLIVLINRVSGVSCRILKGTSIVT